MRAALNNELFVFKSIGLRSPTHTVTICGTFGSIGIVSYLFTLILLLLIDMHSALFRFSAPIVKKRRETYSAKYQLKCDCDNAVLIICVAFAVVERTLFELNGFNQLRLIFNYSKCRNRRRLHQNFITE